MKHAPIHSKSPRQDASVPMRRPSAGPNGRALVPPAYGIDFVDQQQSTTGGMPIQCQSREGSSAPERQKENNTGLPDQLKAGIETLSGISMSDVRVHTHSSAPARLNAHAYTQGREIFVAPGQERHLPHEAWHVVQQAQGRVRETARLRSGVSINGDRVLEQEADLMGRRATQLAAQSDGTTDHRLHERTDADSRIHPNTLLSAGSPVAQADVGFEFQTFKEDSGFYRKSKKFDRYVKFNAHQTYATSVNSDPAWEVQNDGGDIEVVVERVPVNESGRKKLGETMDKVVSVFTNLQTQQGENGDMQTLKPEQKKKMTRTEKTLKASDLHSISEGKLQRPLSWSEKNKTEEDDKEPEDWADLKLFVTPELKAHPQVTAGIRLDKLLETFELISKADYKEIGDKNKQGLAHQLGFYKKKSKKHRGTIKSAVGVGKRAKEKSLSPNLQGFLTIIAEYIIGWQKAGKLEKRTPYAKNCTPIMGRTNLATVFTQVLNEKEREIFRKLVQDEKALTEMFDLGENLLEKNLFGQAAPNDVTEEELNEEQKENLKKKNLPQPTKFKVKNFLSSLADKESIDLSSEDYGPQAIGSQDEEKDTIIDEKNQVKGIAVELRKLRGEVPLKDWKTFALHAFDLTELINRQEEKKNLNELPTTTNNSFAQKEMTSSSSSLTTGSFSLMTNQQKLNMFSDLMNNN